MSDAPGPRPARPWEIERHEGSAAALHALERPAPWGRRVWSMTLTHDALVLGSTQSSSVVDAPALAAGHVDLVSRRSGGGAVLLVRQRSLWIDVLVPRDDPLWVDDVGRSFDWLGAAWIRALRSLAVAGGDELVAFAGPMRRTPMSDLVCFAGLGPGEVAMGERKIVGLSQRRSRAGARFQCLAYLGADAAAEAIIPLLAVPEDPAARAELRAHLAARVAALPVDADTILSAFLDALPG